MFRPGDGVVARRTLDPRKLNQSGPIVPQGLFGKVTSAYSGRVTVRFDNGAHLSNLTENDVE